jgi:CHASE2 domain-containing sensor protein
VDAPVRPSRGQVESTTARSLFGVSLLASPILQLLGGLLQGAHGESSYFERWPGFWLYLAAFGLAIYANTRNRDSAARTAVGALLAILAFALVTVCSIVVRVLIFGSGIA